MSHQDDSGFFRTFGLVLGALVLFTIFIALMANLFSPATDRSGDQLVQQQIADQIAPVGQSRVSAPAPAAESAEQPQVQPVAASTVAETEAPAATDADTADTAATEADTAAADGENTVVAGAESTQADAPVIADAVIPTRVKAVVETNCAGCHLDGLNGAQRSDDAQAWQGLAAKGLDALTASVVNGKGAMLPRAETTLTDAEITLAIQHMIAQSGAQPVATGGSAAAPAATAPEQTGADTTAQVDEAASQETDASADIADEADAASADTANETDAASADTANEADAASTDTAGEADAAGADTTGEADAAGDDATAAVVATADIPDNVKAVVDSLCAGCHISGVANAPKFGDKAAWDERLSVGMDKLLASAIAGKGAMPARGGAQLSDAELRLAIEYMISK
jgi:cytochrome c5